MALLEAMGDKYDEDLTENEFFKLLKNNYRNIYRRVYEELWTVRSSSGAFFQKTIVLVDAGLHPEIHDLPMQQAHA